MRKLALLGCILMTGCATVVTPDEVRFAPNLLVPCPPMEKLTGKDGAAVVRWATFTVNLDESCRLEHNGLVEAVVPKG